MPNNNNKKKKRRRNNKRKARNRVRDNNSNNSSNMIQQSFREHERHRLNFMQDAQVGCHVVNGGECRWVLNYESFDRDDWGFTEDDVVPDISIDPQSKILSVFNPTVHRKAYYISTSNTLRDGRGRELSKGTIRDYSNNESSGSTSCTTLVIHVGALHVMDVCYVDVENVTDVDLHSDVSEVRVSDTGDNKQVLSCGFPLDDSQGPYQCTQGHNGLFTHFYPQTQYAVDLACPVGTDVLAVHDGEIMQVQDQCTVSGVHVQNLFTWNSILLKLDDNRGFCEYVHIQAGSALVRSGDRVVRGQVICKSGDIGFCPTPHLHIQMHRTMSAKAPTVPFAFEIDNANHHHQTFVPVAGLWYSAKEGHVATPTKSPC